MPDITLEVLHRGPGFVVVNKPAGLVVHRGWANDDVTVMDIARDQLGAKVWPAHRLDRMTSGALALALDTETLSAMQRAFAARQVGKRYLALVRGRPGRGGVVRYRIPKAEKGPRVDAETRWSLAHQATHYALLEAWPRTGRLHQIRRHFRHIGHPIVWDRKYGRGRFNERCRADSGLARMALHACDLCLPRWPSSGSATGERQPMLRVHAPVPDDLAEPLRKLGVPEHWLR